MDTILKFKTKFWSSYKQKLKLFHHSKTIKLKVTYLVVKPEDCCYYQPNGRGIKAG